MSTWRLWPGATHAISLPDNFTGTGFFSHKSATGLRFDSESVVAAFFSGFSGKNSLTRPEQHLRAKIGIHNPVIDVVPMLALVQEMVATFAHLVLAHR